jgi:hypothetical protein
VGEGGPAVAVLGPVQQIVSGGQTGADRAGLDWALTHGLAHGGWCPRGRRAEDGPIPARYLLAETASGTYPPRTEANIRDSDATVVFTLGSEYRPRSGTALTLGLAARAGRPYLHLWGPAGQAGADLAAFLAMHGVRSLNVAGPRASGEPKIYDYVLAVLDAAAGSNPDGGM